jgi:hypothetical protein
MGEEGSFPFISFLDVDVVVPPSDIEFGEQSAATKVVYPFCNKW